MYLLFSSYFFPHMFSVKTFFIACHSIAPRAVLAKSAIPVPGGVLHLNSSNLRQTPVIPTGPWR